MILKIKVVSDIYGDTDIYELLGNVDDIEIRDIDTKILESIKRSGYDYINDENVDTTVFYIDPNVYIDLYGGKHNHISFIGVITSYMREIELNELIK